MIDLLADWMKKHEPTLRGQGFTMKLSVDEVNRQKKAARLDLSRGSRIGTAILWTNGDCELDALLPDGTDMVSEYRVVASLDDLEHALDWVVERM